ncbi:MAG: DNA-deoxyinosine glycosylase [Oscillospiraceae bacterium]|nr:DNA-deoxyinosine glycosylase [Oscillospiraceae bacterium]
MIVHPIPPLYNSDSRTLILGSFPSVKSREQAFFYGHPQNRFWRVLAGVFNEAVPQSIEQKREFILSHNLALWDTIESCEITNSSDSSIKNVVPNNLDIILKNSRIERIFTNGKASQKYYDKFLKQKYGEAICLPSTSPANAAFSLEKLINEWKIIK